MRRDDRDDERPNDRRDERSRAHAARTGAPFLFRFLFRFLLQLPSKPKVYVNPARADLTNREMAEALFTEMGLRGKALELAWLAFNEHPAGTVAIALAAFEGTNPAGLFSYKREQGEHLINAGGGQRRTGWTFARGSHSGTYVRDPRGVDVLPAGYGTTG